VGKPEGKRPLGRSRLSSKIILRRILENRIGWYGLDSSGSGQGPVEGSCEHCNEPSGSIKFREVLE
jgi:hypothetical protein